MAKTVTNNSWNDEPAGCDDDKATAKKLGNEHPKSQPPPTSPFASGPKSGGKPLTPPQGGPNPDEEY